MFILVTADIQRIKSAEAILREKLPENRQNKILRYSNDVGAYELASTFLTAASEDKICIISGRIEAGWKD